MTRENLKQGKIYVWHLMLVRLAKIWTDRVAYSTPTQVITVYIVENPLGHGVGNTTYKKDDKVIIDNWQDDLKETKYISIEYSLISAAFGDL